MSKQYTYKPIPVQLSQAVENSLLTKLSKEEFLTLKLISNWKALAPHLAAISTPVRIYLHQETLILAADPGYSMSLQYESTQICQIVNSYLGKHAISKVMVRSRLQGSRTC